MEDFYERMKEQQIKYKESVLGIEEMGKWRGRPYPHILPEEKWSLNLWEGVREEAQHYFEQNQIAWHRYRHNMLSSQAMCVNIFFPLKQHLDVFKPWLLGKFPDVEKVTSLDFEYIGPQGKDYFNEKGGRGQNRTSSDICITWEDEQRKKNMLLLEFKFTERDFGVCSRREGQDDNLCRNSEKIVASPQTQCYRAQVGRTYWEYILRNDSPFKLKALTTESYCPFRYDFYQLMRNQLLAHCIQSDREAGLHRVEFGVIHHADNEALLRMGHAFSGERDPFKAWPTLLKNPNTFHVFTVQDFLYTVEAKLPTKLANWRTYLKQRYGS